MRTGAIERIIASSVPQDGDLGADVRE